MSISIPLFGVRSDRNHQPGSKGLDRWRALAARPVDAEAVVTAVAAVATVALAMAHSHGYSGATVDDSFITYRHARHLIEGYGFSYHAHEAVEGTSTPLFGLLMSLPLLAGLDPLVGAAAINTAAFCVCVVTAQLIVREFVPGLRGVLLGSVAALLVAGSTALAYHSRTGMETGFFAALFAVGLYLHIREGQRELPRWWSSLPFAAAVVTRPDGVMLASLILGASLGRRLLARQKGGLLARALTREWVPVLAAVFTATILRRVYFGEWLPLPLIAKGGYLSSLVNLGPQAALEALFNDDGYQMLEQFAGGRWFLGWVLAMGLTVRRIRYFATLAILLVGACSVMVLGNAGDWMMHERLLTPALTPLVVSLVLGLEALLFQGRSFAVREQIVVLALGLSMAGTSAARASFKQWPDADAPVVEMLERIGKHLALSKRSTDSLATTAAGVAPYYAEMPTIDMLGLCDRHIAHNGTPAPRLGKEDWDYVVRQRPEFYAFLFYSELQQLYTNEIFREQGDEYYIVLLPGYLGYRHGDPPMLLVRGDRLNRQQLKREFGLTAISARDELVRLRLLSRTAPTQ